MGKNIDKAMAMMRSEGRKILEDRKKEAMTEGIEDKKDVGHTRLMMGLSDNLPQLVSILVKGNLTATNPKDMLRDEELMDAVTTFTLAGHETRSQSQVLVI